MWTTLQRPLARRRFLIAMPAGLLALPALAGVAQSIGEASAVRGRVVARQKRKVRDLAAGAALLLRDSVETAEQSFARLELAGKTTVHLGSRTRLLIDSYVADVGGLLELGEGAMLLDRADDLPKIDLVIRSQFALIAVRGTRFFAGPSRGAFGVFVVRGALKVQAAGVTRRLRAGQGVDIKAVGQPPGKVAAWKPARVREALDSVGA